MNNLPWNLTPLYDVILKRIGIPRFQPMTSKCLKQAFHKLLSVIVMSDVHIRLCYLQSSFMSVFLCETHGHIARQSKQEKDHNLHSVNYRERGERSRGLPKATQPGKGQSQVENRSPGTASSAWLQASKLRLIYM